MAIASDALLYVPPDARAAILSIEARHGDLLEHLEQAEPVGRANSRAALKFRGLIRGCVWFADPVTDELLLDPGERLAWAMSEEAWAAIALSFPALRPVLMTGSVTGSLAARFPKGRADEVADFFRRGGDDLATYCLLDDGDYYWAVFATCEKRRFKGCSPADDLGIETYGVGGWQPLPGTVGRGRRISAVAYGGGKPRPPEGVPACLEPRFFQ